MPFTSSGIIKPIVWLLWFNFVISLIVTVLNGQLSIESAFFKGIVVFSVIFAWTIGVHQYLHLPSSTLSTQIKGLLIHTISSLLYLVLFLGIFFFNDDRLSKAQYMIALSIMSLVWAFLLYRRIRFLEDTSHSTLNSAAQGYAVLKGKVTLYEGEIVRGPHKELPPMVWYKNHLFSSSAGFLLNDEKGVCTVDPRDAEVITPRHHYGSKAYYAIFPGETIYVIGQLETLSKQRNEFERKALVTSKIIEWKRRHLKFLDYFDRNGDGKVDEKEMAVGRNSAERSVEENLEAIYQEPASHVVYRPTDGRPFIISSIHPDDLLIRYKRAMIIHFSAWITFTIFALAMQVQ